MSKPNNSISKIKLPGENTGRPIVPYHVGVSSSNTFVATLPALTADAEFIINKLNQSIDGTKTFNNETQFKNGAFFFRANYDGYVSVTEEYIDIGAATGYSHSMYYDNKIDYSPGGTNLYHLYFPEKTGTLAITDDITGKADDSDVVHKGTNSSSVTEIIYGEKKFGNTVRFGAYSAGATTFLSEGSISSSSLTSMNIDAVYNLILGAKGFPGVATSGFRFEDYYKPGGSGTTYTNTYKFPDKTAANKTYVIATTDDFINLSDRIQLDDAISANRPDTGSPTTPTTILTVAKFDAWYATGKTKIRMSGTGDCWADTCSYDTVTINGVTCNRIQTNMNGSMWNAYKYNNQVYAYGYNGGQDYLYFCGTDPEIYEAVSGKDYSKLAINAEALSSVATILKLSDTAYSGPITIFSNKTGGICPISNIIASYGSTSTSLSLSSYTGQITLGNSNPITLSNSIGIAPGTSTSSHYFTHRLNNTNYNLYLPNKTGIFATTSDIINVVANPSSTTATLTGITIGDTSYAVSASSGDHYPTTFTWTNGTTAGPTGSLTGNSGFTAVSFGAIPSASMTQSGIVNTDTQAFYGAKTFGGHNSYGGGFQFTVASTGDAGSLVGIWNGSASTYPTIGTIKSINFRQGNGGTHSAYSYSTTLIGSANSTANRTITLPDNTGTVALTSDLPQVIDLR